MAQRTVTTKAVFLGILIAAMVCPAFAQQGQQRITGDWMLTSEFNGQKMTSILSLSRGEDNQLKGRWISFMGVSDLKDVKFEGGKLSFVQVFKFGDQENTSNFEGTIEQNAISGTLKGERGEFKMEGKRAPRTPRGVGIWEVKVKATDREYTGTLTIKADAEGKLSGDWQSTRGKSEISNLVIEQNKVTFTRKTTVQDQVRESTFEGTIKGDALTGTLKSDRGESTVEGTRAGAAAIGVWDLTLTSDTGNPRMQVLNIRPDLSALYGTVPVEKVTLEGENLSFKTTMSFGDQKSEISFTAKLADGKMTGEVTTQRGTRKVEGKKQPAPQRRAGGGQQAKAEKSEAAAPETDRRPDVVYVPTPQIVVDKMLELAKVGKDDLVYDLGCGDGRIVVTAAQKYGCKAIGFDIATERVKESMENVAKAGVGDKVRIEQRDVFTLDLSPASVVTLYLLPSLNVKLIPQLEKLKPGCRIVSHDFDMKGIKPDQVITLDSNGDPYGDHTIYLWTTPLKKEAEEKK
jgi:hypothetical protein